MNFTLKIELKKIRKAVHCSIWVVKLMLSHSQCDMIECTSQYSYMLLLFAAHAAVASCVVCEAKRVFLFHVYSREQWQKQRNHQSRLLLVTDFSFQWGFQLALLIRLCGFPAPSSDAMKLLAHYVIMVCWYLCINIVEASSTQWNSTASTF